MGLTGDSAEVTFFDDRMEEIDDHVTDLVAISVETYTAKRAYQIAVSEYRRRESPSLWGGFHPTLCPDEVMEYAEAESSERPR